MRRNSFGPVVWNDNITIYNVYTWGIVVKYAKKDRDWDLAEICETREVARDIKGDLKKDDPDARFKIVRLSATSVHR